MITRGMLYSFAFLLVACYPEEDFIENELGLVITEYNDQINFSDYQSYGLPSQIIKFKDGVLITDEESPIDRTILSNIRTEMTTQGYTEEIDLINNKPDLLVLLVAQQDAIKQVDNYPLWGWWDWWGNPFPWWEFDGNWSGISPALPISEKTNVGTLRITMIDIKNANNTKKEVNIPWNAILNGLIAEDSAIDESNVTDGIKQAFQQSPYLKTN